jgi:VanZ family protein
METEFYGNGMNGRIAATAQIVAWLLLIVIIVLSLVPPELRPETGAPHNVEHFALFAAAGLAFGFGYSRRPGRVAFALIIFAGAIELGQTLIPGRHARLSDFIVDAAAMCVSVVVGSIVAAHYEQRGA